MKYRDPGDGGICGRERNREVVDEREPVGKHS